MISLDDMRMKSLKFMRKKKYYYNFVFYLTVLSQHAICNIKSASDPEEQSSENHSIHLILGQKGQLHQLTNRWCYAFVFAL